MYTCTWAGVFDELQDTLQPCTVKIGRSVFDAPGDIMQRRDVVWKESSLVEDLPFTSSDRGSGNKTAGGGGAYTHIHEKVALCWTRA